MELIEIARICHEANRILCEVCDDHSQPAWEDAEPWVRETLIDGLQHLIANPVTLDSANHERWLAKKLADGWVYGPVKNVEEKVHPCILVFDALPEHQKAKDRQFLAIGRALLPLCDPRTDPHWPPLAGV